MQLLHIYNSIIAELRIDYPKDKHKDSFNALLVSGKWYYVSRDYYAELEKWLDKNLNTNFNYCGINFIAFEDKDKDSRGFLSEGVYNQRLAQRNNIYDMDKKNYHISQHFNTRKYKRLSQVELCDVLKYDDESNEIYLIHNKRYGGAPGISHLVTQANISLDILLDKEEGPKAIQHINNKVGSQLIPLELKREQISIILGIITNQKGKKTKEIFTILEMKALETCIRNIKNQGVNIKIQLISDKTTKIKK